VAYAARHEEVAQCCCQVPGHAGSAGLQRNNMEGGIVHPRAVVVQALDVLVAPRLHHLLRMCDGLELLRKGVHHARTGRRRNARGWQQRRCERCGAGEGGQVAGVQDEKTRQMVGTVRLGFQAAGTRQFRHKHLVITFFYLTPTLSSFINTLVSSPCGGNAHHFAAISGAVFVGVPLLWQRSTIRDAGRPYSCKTGSVPANLRWSGEVGEEDGGGKP
jgi:hypothetical protein